MTLWLFDDSMCLMFGAHLSIAGGMVNALHEAKRLKMDCVQVFTANQRQWNPTPPTEDRARDWLATLVEMGWDSSITGEPARVVSHSGYLINLASPDPGSWKKSIAAQRKELERCEALHIPFCVIHPGAHLSGSRSRKDVNRLDGKSTRTELAGLKRIARALDTINRDLPAHHTVTCLETTVGSGTNLGYNFNHLAFIRDRVNQPERVGFCFDTCHVTAAGYDMTTPRKAEAVLQQWGQVCGFEHLYVFHMNDSEGGVGSRRDRHTHIGQGTCGRSCFRAIVNHPRGPAVPKILETPKGTNETGREWDAENLRRLRRMVRRTA